MKLEVGGYYVLRNGEKVGPLNNNKNMVYPFDNGGISWTEDGRFHSNRPDFPLDIVAIDPIWKAVAEDYIDELVATYPSKAQLLMERDEGFRMAAERLANKLAHALLTEGEAYRRVNQKVILWQAACLVLVDKGASVAFGDGLIIREG